MSGSVDKNLKDFEALLEKCNNGGMQIRTTPKLCRSCIR